MPFYLERITGKKSLDSGIDWMYQGSAEVKEEQDKREAEEYLLGKEFTGGTAVSKQPVGEFAESVRDEELFLKQRITSTAQSSQGASQSEVAKANEEFAKRMEDPMYLVNQKRQERINDQHKKQILLEKVMGDPNDSRAREKKSKKSKDDRHHLSSRDRKKKHKYHRKRSRSRSNSSNRSRSRDRDRRVDNRHRSHRHSDHSRYRISDNDDRYDHEAAHEGDKLSHQAQPKKSQKSPGYGLQGSSSKTLDTSDIGPSRQSLERKRKEKDIITRQHRKHSRQNISAEEKQRKLREMQSDAYKRDLDKEESLKRKTYENNDVEISGKATFLSGMASEVNSMSMRDRLASKRHTLQKTSDLSNFL